MANRARPLSPHLQVYRWRSNMLVSILHRVTGSGLATVGAAVLLWWLLAAASGPQAYAFFLDAATSPLGRLVLFGLTFVFFQHLCSGVRHLYMDTGEGYDPATSRKLASFTLVGSTILTLVTWCLVYFA